MKYLKFNQKRKISYGRQYISNEDIQSVKKSLNSDMITQGAYVDLFENKLRNYFKSKYSLVVSNGTAALHLAMLSLNLSSKDTVVTSPLSFLASANCVEYVGAKVDFCDIEKTSYTLDPNKLEDKLKKKNIKAVIVVDYAGHPADWESFYFLKKKYKFVLVNDNCHALGSKLNNDKAYSSKFADIVTQSFHPVKQITTGEGGAIITNNKKIYSKCLLLRNHGIKRNKEKWWSYSMSELGFNYRISDINCALGSSQISRLSKIIKRKREIAQLYNKKIKNDFLQLPVEKQNVYHSYHLYPLLIDFKKLKISKDSFIQEMSKKDITLQVHYKPIHLQNYYKNKYGFKKNDFKIAENFYSKEVSLPIYYGLKTKDQIKVIKTMDSILKKIRI
jgi:UDP-4-amino-4,6-dideoxy-N-acetyl-beta-L-altrosamine transaminase